MPELPEVETIKKDLQKEIKGYRILKIETDTPRVFLPSYKRVKEKIEGLEIKNFKRRAKLLIFEFDKPRLFLIFHLKMTGRILLREEGCVEDKWVRAVFKLENSKLEIKKELRFADMRKFGYIKLADQKKLQEVLSRYGVEPLDDLDLEKFRKIFAGKKKAVKAVLMDQSQIAGVGNIYANEALFLASIHPEIPSRQLDDKQLKKLFDSLEKILKKGLKLRGASDQTYVDAYGEKGHYQEHFLVYGRKGKPCFECQSKIKKFSLNGRGTFFCPQCQRIYR